MSRQEQARSHRPEIAVRCCAARENCPADGQFVMTRRSENTQSRHGVVPRQNGDLDVVGSGSIEGKQLAN
ncbi:protein of unknown function [Burkholderia multivorans]